MCPVYRRYRSNFHHISCLRRMDHLSAANIDSHVPGVTYHISRLRIADRLTAAALGAGRTSDADSGNAVAILNETGTVKR